MYLSAPTPKQNGRALGFSRIGSQAGLLRLGIGKNGTQPGRCFAEERGASIVEFAMVLPLFIGLLMGFIDFGLNLNNISSVRQAVREGVRDVAVGDPGDAVCTLIAPANPVVAAKTKNLLCGIRKSVPGSSVRLRLSYPNDHESGEKAVICAQYQVASATGFYKSLLTKTVTKVQTQMRIERVETGLDEFSESTFAGQNWNWCP